ncbi:MAG TPA: hypothetical protein VGE02_03035, partial [Gemmatimonadales bacterium]
MEDDMRKTMMAMGLGAALAFGGAGTALAQATPSTPAQKTPQAEARGRMHDGARERVRRDSTRRDGARRMEGRER